MSEHFLGDLNSARRHLEQVLSRGAPISQGRDDVHLQDIIRFQIHGHVSARAFHARVLWFQGFSDQAVRTAETSIQEAQATGHALTLCYALALAACPVSLWVGNPTAAAHYTEMLVENSRKHDLRLWSAYGSRFQMAVVLMAGDIEPGSRLLEISLNEIAQSNVSVRSPTGLTQIVEILIRDKRMAEGFEVLKWMEQLEAAIYSPELLRLKGELSRLLGTQVGAEAAKDHFQQALDEARRQGTLAWELRAAMSLARLLRDQGRPNDGSACLQPIYDRFTEGFATADLTAAKRLLDDLGTAGRR
jgi:hypothetical protein